MCSINKVTFRFGLKGQKVSSGLKGKRGHSRCKLYFAEEKIFGKRILVSL